MKKIIFSIVMLFIIVGCATQKAYEGVEKGSNMLSVITPASGIAIRKVDEYYLDKLKSGGFETLPGKHIVIVSVLIYLGPTSGFSSTPLFKMEFNTEAGKKYIIDFKGKIDSKVGLLSREDVPKGEYFVIEESSGEIIYKIEN